MTLKKTVQHKNLPSNVFFISKKNLGTTPAELQKHFKYFEHRGETREKIELRLELVKIRLRLGLDLRPRDYASRALNTQPRTQNKHLPERDQKAALSNEIKKKQK